MIDSWGKIPSGLMRGNFYELGNFEQCVNFNKKLPTPFGKLEGQYCRAAIPLAQTSQEIADTLELMNRMKDNKEARGMNFKLRSGICLPKSCSIKDLQEVLPFKISLCKSKTPIPFEPLDYICMYVALKNLYINEKVNFIFIPELLYQY